MTHKIAILGPESCGKTTLARALAEALQAEGHRAAWAPEYARQFYADRPYLGTADEIEAIAAGQLAAEDAAGKDADWLLCDTTALTCKIWMEAAHGAATPGLLRLCHPEDYALTLLALPDIPWEYDPLRSHPTQRDELLDRYRRELAAQGIAAVELAGAHAARMAQARAALGTLWPALLPKK